MLNKLQFELIKKRVNSIFPVEAREDIALLCKHIEELNQFSDSPEISPLPTVNFKYHSLIGINSFERMSSEFYQFIQMNKIQAVRFNYPIEIDSTITNNLKALGIKFMMTRIQSWWNISTASKMFNLGITYFDIFDQPNLAKNGMWKQWQNGKEFSEHYHGMLEELKKHLPDALYGFPGLALGNGDTTRYNSVQFLQEASEAYQEADFVNIYSYWDNDTISIDDALDTVFQFCVEHMEKPVFISGFSCSDPDVDDDTKWKGYKKFFKELKTMPSNFGGAFLIP